MKSIVLRGQFTTISGVDRYTITIACTVESGTGGKYVPKILMDGYVIQAEALRREDGWMPSATIHQDRPGDDRDDVTDDYRVIAPEDVRFATQQEAIDHAEVLGRTWISQKG
jgi:hypothetical protein